MKFCYIDESGMSKEPFAVMVGVIVDARRMHVTKQDWQQLLNYLSSICGCEVKEFHTKDFYSGKSIWRNLDGSKRSEIITKVIEWFKRRKHKITFAGVDKKLFEENFQNDQKLVNLGNLWCFLAMHIILTIQKNFQKDAKNKGNTVLIFDKQRYEANLCRLILNPPAWTDKYYNKKRESSLSQIIDVPYYGNSQEVCLIQIADLFAYLLRRYIELKEREIKEKYTGEKEILEGWIKQIGGISIDKAARFPATKNDASELFCRYAPKSLQEIG